MKANVWSFAFCAAALLLSPNLSTLRAQEKDTKPAEKPSEPAPPPPKEESSVTEHSIKVAGQSIPYKATAGTILLKNEKDEPQALIYYTAYTRGDVKDPSQRPLSFLYNGGPGSSSHSMSYKENNAMNQTKQEKNKALVLEAFDTLFNKRDYAAAERFWSPDYIQHSAHIEPGREGLFKLVKNAPATLQYEPGLMVAEGDFVIVHGRFSHFGLPVNWIAADILLIQNGILVEHWDVIQDEATEEQSKSKRPMFGAQFPTYA